MMLTVNSRPWMSRLTTTRLSSKPIISPPHDPVQAGAEELMGQDDGRQGDEDEGGVPPGPGFIFPGQAVEINQIETEQVYNRVPPPSPH